MNLADLIIFSILLYYGYKGFRTGFVGGALNLLATALAFYSALLFYNPLGQFLSARFTTEVGFSKLTAFLFLLIGIDIILSYIFSLSRAFIMERLKNTFLAPLYLADKVLGVIPAV